MLDELPRGWRDFMGTELDSAGLDTLLDRVANERAAGVQVFPPEGALFTALELTPPEEVRVVLLGQASDLGRAIPESGSLRNWAAHGVLLLNSVLSVRAHAAGSHRKFGWECFTDAVIRSLNRKEERIVFLLWGNFAIAKRPLIDELRHVVFENVHPSPLSAHRGFFGSRPFSRAEQALGDWTWPEL